MISRGKVKHLKILYPYNVVSVLWEELRTYVRDNGIEYRGLTTVAPEVAIYHDPREYYFNPLIREVATKGYYDGAKRLDTGVNPFANVLNVELGNLTIKQRKERDPTKGFEQTPK